MGDFSLSSEILVEPREQVSALETLRDRILKKTAKIGVVGLGYVGLPLAVEFARAGFEVIGIDVQQSKVDQFNSGESYIKDVKDVVFAPLVGSGKLRATTDFSVIRDLDTINICVPTPLRKTKDPDMSYIVLLPGDRQAFSCRHAGDPGIDHLSRHHRRTAAADARESRSARSARISSCAFRPSAWIPAIRSIRPRTSQRWSAASRRPAPKWARCSIAQALETVVPVSSTRVAEMVKLLENTFRMINIGLVNEMALMCDRMGINVWEVIDAAATKPFGFMPFYPGPGLGGHCIPIDPFYLSWKTKQAGIEARFIELAGYINGQMPHFVVDKIQNALNDAAKPVKGSRIHILGVAYKRDIDDVRESPALDMMLLLQRLGALVTFSDPFVKHIRIDGKSLENQDLLPAAETADCVVIVTDHTGVDYRSVVERSRLIVDTRNALKGVESEKIVRL